VSVNDNCHCTATTKVAVKVMGRNAWRGKPSGDLGKQTFRCRRNMLGCRLYGQQQVATNREGQIADSGRRTFSDSENRL